MGGNNWRIKIGKLALIEVKTFRVSNVWHMVENIAESLMEEAALILKPYTKVKNVSPRSKRNLRYAQKL